MSLEPDDESDSPGCDVAAMLELQVSEVEMLTSMFPNKAEFSLDDPTAVKIIQSFLDGQVKYEYLHKRIGFSLHVNPEGSRVRSHQCFVLNESILTNVIFRRLILKLTKLNASHKYCVPRT